MVLIFFILVILRSDGYVVITDFVPEVKLRSVIRKRKKKKEIVHILCKMEPVESVGKSSFCVEVLRGEVKAELFECRR